MATGISLSRAVARIGLSLGLMAGAAATGAASTDAHCGFDVQRLQFAGSPREQAQCLLRPVGPGGLLGPPASLPEPLASWVGEPTSLDEQALRNHLGRQGIGVDQLGGPLEAPLSRAGAAQETVARYFVIHDTSVNVCDDLAQWARSDEPDAPWNRHARWADDPNAHLFITRDGKLIAPRGRTFAQAWRATKLEAAFGVVTRGLFLHVENVQLRSVALVGQESARDEAGLCRNDRRAQQPGVSAVQLSRLALAYIAASHRARRWLIPAFHAGVDAGIAQAHDDPQNFDLAAWAGQLCHHLAALGRPCPRAPRGPG